MAKRLWWPLRAGTLQSKVTALIGDEETTGTRVLNFSETRVDGPTEFWRIFRFTVDGRTFDPDRVDQRVPLGAVEEWTIINDQPNNPEDHVFHIHRATAASPSARASSILPANSCFTAT